MHRTTLLLDEESRRAARELAIRLDCSASEAIRRAIVRYRDSLFGIPASSRKERKAALSRLIDLFEGHDSDAEIARLKAEDPGF